MFVWRHHSVLLLARSVRLVKHLVIVLFINTAIWVEALLDLNLKHLILGNFLKRIAFLPPHLFVLFYYHFLSLERGLLLYRIHILGSPRIVIQVKLSFLIKLRKLRARIVDDRAAHLLP